MRKALIAIITASALFAIGAFAANLTTQADNVASGQDAVVACGSAEVTWTTDSTVTTSTTTADWKVTAATVTFTGANCEGAAVDLAIGTNSTGSGTASAWLDLSSCTAVNNGVSNCAIPLADQPFVRQVVDVAVLANGNEVVVV